MGVAVWLSTIGPSERLSTRLDGLGQFLVGLDNSISFWHTNPVPFLTAVELKIPFDLNLRI